MLGRSCIGLMLLASQCVTADGGGLRVDPDTLLFRPVAEINSDPMCDELVERVTDWYLSPEPEPSLPDETAVWVPEFKQFQDDDFSVEEHPRAPPKRGVRSRGERETFYAHFVVVRGRKVYLEDILFPGCGNACDGRVFYASLHPIEQEWKNRRVVDATGVTSIGVPAYSYSMLRGAGDSIYLVAHEAVASIDEDPGRLNVYRLRDDAVWLHACSIRTWPRDVELADNNAVRELAAAFAPLAGLHRKIFVGDGGPNCEGSLPRSSINRAALLASQKAALFRPWIFSVPRTSYEKGLAANEREWLRYWSLLGLHEHARHEEFRSLLSEYSRKLSDFLAAQYRWPRSDADRVASRAASSTFDFIFPSGRWGFPSGSTLKLRQAILDNRPVSELADMLVGKDDLDGGAQPHRESVLNIAIGRPDVLELLLQRGADPNAANAFGKTPLMYAAQFNQLESAKLLVRHGANPNLATVRPQDTCYYTISSHGVTALHYAVRYASRSFIKWLVGVGAVTAATDSAGRLPLDYLVKRQNEAGRRLRDDDRAELTTILEPLSEALRAGRSRKANLEAEALYREGRIREAYVKVKESLILDAGNERATVNLSLIALRLGQHGESARAAGQVASSAASDQERASAYFNLALTCAAEDRRTGKDGTEMVFDGERFCYDHEFGSGPLPYLLRSYETAPSGQRSRAIVEFFADADAAAGKWLCRLAGGRSPSAVYTMKHGDGFFVLASSGMTRMPEVMWKDGAGTLVPELIEKLHEIDIGDGLSIYRLLPRPCGRARNAFLIDGELCEAPERTAH